MDASLLQQHEKTRAHRVAMGDATVAAQAPSEKDFVAVLESVKSRGSHRPLQNVAGRNKMRKMVFCLAEAARALDRMAWRDATCMTLMQDVRAGRLLVRYRCCGPGLTTRCGVLGQVRVPEGGALRLRQATLDVLSRACTPRHCAPMSPANGKLQKELLVHLTQIVKFFTADAAGDEQVAGEGFKFRKYNSLLDAFGACFPRLQVVCANTVRNLKPPQPNLSWQN
jgi:hypothetical protein